MNQVLNIPAKLYQQRIDYLRTGIDPEGRMPVRIDPNGVLFKMVEQTDPILLRMARTLEAVLIKKDLPEPTLVGIGMPVVTMGDVRDSFRAFTDRTYEEPTAFSVNSYLSALMTLSHKTVSER